MTRLGLRLAWVLPACLFVLAACGGDDDKNSSSAAGSPASAGGGGKPAAGGGGTGGGSTGSGRGEEGTECSSDTECGSGLKCLPGAVLQGSTRSLLIKVCARNCLEASDCMSGETCTSDVTNQPKDALCWSTTTEAFKPCGPAATSKCVGDLECLPVIMDDGAVGGYCVQPCELPSANPMARPCGDGLSCLDGLDIEGVGLCAKRVGRSETCGPEIGALCGPEDVCLNDPKDGSSLCYQDCTKTKMCETGKTCIQLETDLSYCE